MLIEANLRAAPSCEALVELVRTRVRARLAEEYAAVEEAIRSDQPFGCGALDGAAAPGPSASEPSSVSSTNNQVAGVDEADSVKADSHHLYVASDTELRILRAWPVAEARDVATVSFGGRVKKLLLDGDRIVVYSVAPQPTEPKAWRLTRDCTYGYDCDFTGDGTATRLTVLDIADRAHPKPIRTVDFAGSLIAARRVGHHVHQVTAMSGLTVPGIVYPSVSGSCARALTEEEREANLGRLDEERASNEAKIEGASVELIAPAMADGAAVGAADCGDFYLDGAGDGSSITSLSSLDVQADGGLHVSNILSGAGAVYASSRSVYMAVRHQRGSARGWYDGVALGEVTTVHRFGLSDTGASSTYAGSGLVPGHVLNQFSMDEYAGHLRVATTTGQTWDPNAASALTVLRPDVSGLALTGSVSGIAPAEDIRSVRFDGDRGYVVTFKKTDPLFVLDLADPAAPRVVGELKIPGFSTYLHRLDANHLLAMGYEGDDRGDFAWFNGIQVQLFDVTDPTDPVLASKQVFGTRGSSSAALTDHLAFTFLPDRGLLTLPMTICEGGGEGAFGSLAFSGVVALDVSVEGGISELGRAAVPVTASTAACTSWWTDADSEVKRTVVMDKALFAISSSDVRIWNLDDLTAPLKVLPL